MEFEWRRAAVNCLRAELLPGKVLLTGYAGREDAACFPQNPRKQNKYACERPILVPAMGAKEFVSPRLQKRSVGPTKKREVTERLRGVKTNKVEKDFQCTVLNV